ncbi:MAG: MarR family winged helix-turn-helix transcriptional regulator [Pseudodonghicola sp.]
MSRPDLARLAFNPHDPERSLSFLLHDVAHLRHKLYDNVFRPAGISRAQAWLLAMLYRENGLTQSELADRLSLGRVACGTLIERMVAAGWLRREGDAQDRRAIRVWLTAAARQVQTDLQRAVDELNEISLDGLDPATIETLIAALMQMKRNLVEANLRPKTRATTAG